MDTQSGSKHTLAKSLLSGAANIDARIPLQVYGEVFTVLTRRRAWSATDAKNVVEGLMEALPLILPSNASFIRAMRLNEKHGIAFWDAQIAAVAAAGGCDILLSEDFQDGRVFAVADVGRTLAVVDPFMESNIAKLSALGFETKRR